MTKCWLGLQSHLRLDWGTVYFRVATVVDKIQFLAVVRPRASFPCWLSVGSLPQFLATWAPQHGSGPHQSQQGRQRPLTRRVGVMESPTRGHAPPITLATLGWLEANCSPIHTRGEGITQGTGRRDRGAALEFSHHRQPEQ